MRAEYERYFRAELGAFPARTAGIDQRLLGLPILEFVPQTWRPDARYFLAVNLEAMIVRPYVQVDGPRDSGATPMRMRFWLLLQRDVERIVQLAEEVARGRNRDYVSATSVAMALGVLAADLATTSLQIWGPRNDDPAPPL